jgi:hypothetical protein
MALELDLGSLLMKPEPRLRRQGPEEGAELLEEAGGPGEGEEVGFLCSEVGEEVSGAVLEGVGGVGVGVQVQGGDGADKLSCRQCRMEVVATGE